VKIWSVPNGGGSEGALQRTYLGHRKSVFEVLYAPRTGHITSCDGSIHVWNPETGYVYCPCSKIVFGGVSGAPPPSAFFVRGWIRHLTGAVRVGTVFGNMSFDATRRWH
jgi:WD40 repeat protein